MAKNKSLISAGRRFRVWVRLLKPFFWPECICWRICSCNLESWPEDNAIAGGGIQQHQYINIIIIIIIVMIKITLKTALLHKF